MPNVGRAGHRPSPWQRVHRCCGGISIARGADARPGQARPGQVEWTDPDVARFLDPAGMCQADASAEVLDQERTPTGSEHAERGRRCP